ncbi:MAG: hypothetical protein NTW49_08845 [Bacteroidia bacterium]|nr:hypothetical protein [Bacteroidia bacterium]
MLKKEINLLVTTGSGIFGGLAKAFSSNMIITEITLAHIGEVALYAAVSAIVGYGLKMAIDHVYKNKNTR